MGMTAKQKREMIESREANRNAKADKVVAENPNATSREMATIWNREMYGADYVPNIPATIDGMNYCEKAQKRSQ